MRVRGLWSDRTTLNGALSREDRLALQQLNSGQYDDAAVPENRVADFLERGLAEENSLGQVVITVHGQLALARDRYSRLRRSRYSVTDRVPRRPLWERLFR